MGDAFLGFQRGYHTIDHLLDTKYDPTHVLSAHMGNYIWKNFINYIPVTGGTMTGLLGSQDIIPSSDNSYDIGTEASKYQNIYAHKFHGTLNGIASMASKLSTPKTISLIGSVVGNVLFDGSDNISITTSTNHNHDEQYLKLTGGSMIGNITLGKDSAVVGYDNNMILDLSNKHILRINYGGYSTNIGTTTIYSAGDLDIRTKSSGVTITSDLYKKTVNVGVSSEAVYISNTEGGDSLSISNDHIAKFNQYKLFHEGNFNPNNVLPIEYKEYVDKLKNVIKVMLISLDQLEVEAGVKTEKDYPDLVMTDQLEYYKTNAADILNEDYRKESELIG